MSARAGIGAAGLALVGCADDNDDEAVAQANLKDQIDEQVQPAEAQAEAPAAISDVQLLNANLGGEANSLDPQAATDTVSIAVLK